ncbi:MAG: hypothetical protein ACK6A4_02195, partial [Alphaproteobacteria bacterium]
RTAVGDKLDERGKIRLTNLNTLWSFSSILHGEQGALSLSASLCHILRDPGASLHACLQSWQRRRAGRWTTQATNASASRGQAAS